MQASAPLVARLVASWRTTGKAASPKAPERIAPKHAAILVTRRVDQMNDEQQQLFDRIVAQCPEVFDLRQPALGFRAARMAEESTQLRHWIEKKPSAASSARWSASPTAS